MDVASTIIRALDSFQGDVEAGVIDNVDIEDIQAARVWTRSMYFEWNQTSTHLEELFKATHAELVKATHAELVKAAHVEPYTHEADMPVTDAPEVIEVLDRLDNTFKVMGADSAHHMIRAVAHGMGWHLTSCMGGRRQAPEGPNW